MIFKPLALFAAILMILPASQELLLYAQGDFQKGLSFYKQGQYEQAVREFEQIVKENPDYEDGFRILGDSFLKLGRYDQAATAFRRALELKNDRFVSYHGLALAHFNNGRYRDSVATLLRGERHARSPRERHQVHLIRGASYFNLREWEKAIEDLTAATSIQRGDARQALQLGIAHFHLDRLDEADKFLRQTLSLDSENATARDYLSRIQFSRGLEALAEKDFKRAAGILQEYVGRNERHGEAWFNLGLAHLFSEDLKAAETAFRRAGQLLPDNDEVFGRLGYVYEMTGAYSQSLDNYRKAYELSGKTDLKESVERVEERIRRQRQGG